MDRVLRILAVVSLVLSACGTEVPSTGAGAAGSLAPEAAAAASEALRLPSHHPRLEVMTRNVYLGADILPIALAQTPADLVAAATTVWAHVQETDFPDRAKVLADEVFWARPDVLGLQEVSIFRTGAPAVCGGANPGAPTAKHVELDFLAILQKEFHRRGLHYEVAAQVTTLDVELCILEPSRKGGFADLRYTDLDVLLVRKDVPWRDPTLPASQPLEDFIPGPPPAGDGDRNGGIFAAAVMTGDQATILPATAFIPVPGFDPIASWRGWTAVEVEREGRWVRVFETHVEDQLDLSSLGLEPWFFQALQDAQLVAILDASLALKPLPTILLGDFNVYLVRDPEVPLPETYVYLTGGTFPPELLALLPLLDPPGSPLHDPWPGLRPSDPGLTWGFDELLRTGKLSTTLDLVLATDDLEPLFTYRVGVHDRTRGGLHPSDHAGLVTGFQIR
jgi:hypothetical protein